MTISVRKNFLCREWPYFLGAIFLSGIVVALNIRFCDFPSRDAIYYSDMIGSYARDFDFDSLQRDFPGKALPYAWVFVSALFVRIGFGIADSAIAVNLLSLWSAGAIFFMTARRMRLPRYYARLGMVLLMLHPTLLKLASQVQRDMFYFGGGMMIMGCFGIFAYRKRDPLPAVAGGLLTAFFAFVRFETLEMLALPLVFFIYSARDGVRAVLYGWGGFLAGVGAFVCVFRLFGIFGIYSERIGQLLKVCSAHF